MDTYEQAKDKIFREITRDNPEVRPLYLKHFSEEAHAFSDAMAQSINIWGKLRETVLKDAWKLRATAFPYLGITFQISSMNLLFSGHMIAAGNMFRQSLETIALSLLCSKRDLGILDLLDRREYSTNKAIRDVLRYADRLGLKKENMRALERSQEFYHNFSHPSLPAIGVFESFAGEGFYLGTSFDEEKIHFYQREVTQRLNLGNVTLGFVSLVGDNINKW